MGTPPSAKPGHLTYDEPHAEHGPAVVCVCGWVKRHPRPKVRLAAAKRHLAKSAGGGAP